MTRGRFVGNFRKTCAMPVFSTSFRCLSQNPSHFISKTAIVQQSAYYLWIKATGGVEGPKIIQGLFRKISLCWERCWRPHQKILFLIRVMIFWKLRFACNYTTRENFFIENFQNSYQTNYTWTISSK